MMKLLQLSATLFFLLVSTGVKAQLKSKLDETFNEFIQKENFSGNILIANFEGKTIYEKSTGYADVRFKIPNTQETRFDIASVSKQFTAALVLILNEEGKLDLQASISDYLPTYRKDTGKEVKVIDLLTHQSGIPNYTSLTGVWTDSLRNHYEFGYLISRFCSGDLEFKAGSKYKYNNSGYAILAAILEEVSGKPFGKLLQETILDPLNLENTGLSSRERIIPLKAYGYAYNGDELQQANYTYMPNLNGAGSMYSTTEDLLKWSLFLHSKSERQVLSNESYRLMTKAYTSDKKWIAPYKNGYGFGLGMFNNAKGGDENLWNTYFHSGHISGFSSYLITFKEDGFVVAILSNMGNISTTEMNRLSVSMVDILKNQNSISSGK